MIADAHFSEDRKYRYSLIRFWNRYGNNILPIVGLNPSKGNETEDDLTIKKCIEFAKRNGKDGIIILNLFAYVSTDPKLLRKVTDPVGKGNDKILLDAFTKYPEVLICWGSTKKPSNRDKEILKWIKKPVCLGITKYGHPRHPSRLSYSTPLSKFTTT